MIKNLKMTLPKDTMLDILDEGVQILEDTIVRVSRWSVHHRIVFEHLGRFWQTTYSVGATESQEESPWQYEDEVECIEVQKVPKTIEVWEPVS